MHRGMLGEGGNEHATMRPWGNAPAADMARRAHSRAPSPRHQNTATIYAWLTVREAARSGKPRGDTREGRWKWHEVTPIVTWGFEVCPRSAPARSTAARTKPPPAAAALQPSARTRRGPMLQPTRQRRLGCPGQRGWAGYALPCCADPPPCAAPLLPQHRTTPTPTPATLIGWPCIGHFTMVSACGRSPER